MLNDSAPAVRRISRYSYVALRNITPCPLQASECIILCSSAYLMVPVGDGRGLIR